MKAVARELAVGDDVEAEVDLARDRRAHLRVDDLLERAVAGGARLEQARRAQQAADDLGASGLARRVHAADLLRKPDSSATGRRADYRYRPLRARRCLAAAGGRAPSRPPGRERDDLRRAARRGRRDRAPPGRPRRARRRPRGDRAGPGRGLLHRAARDPAPGGGRRPGRPAPRARASASASLEGTTEVIDGPSSRRRPPRRACATATTSTRPRSWCTPRARAGRPRRSS